jgi:hypothetical protein
MLANGNVAGLLNESHEAQTARALKFVESASSQPLSFSKTARAAALAGAGEVGRACKIPFTYDIESDPVVASKFLAKLTLPARHSHIAPHSPTVRLAKNCIPVKDVTEVFTRMPTKYAAHRDGWTWELLRDVAQRPSTTALFAKFTKQFFNGTLPKGLWVYLASSLM